MRKIRIDFKRMKEVVSKVIRKDIIILIIAILVLFYVLVQASVVPFWNKELETEHIDVVYSDMTSLKSDLTDVAQHGIPRSSRIHLGVLYPNRFLFFNPGPGAAGNLTVENVGITGSYAASGASTHQISYDSSRIIYVLDGIIPGPKLVYEHGIIIWDWGDNRTVTANNQSLINDDTGTIFIPVVNANPCVTAGVETEIFEIYPYSNTSDRAGVESVTITLDTDYPELWQELLKEHIKAGLVSVSNQTKKIRIHSSTLPYISLPDQPAPGVVSSGIITFSKEQPAVLTIPAAIMQNATVEKKVTSTPKVTPTPTPTARARVSGGGGGGGGGGGIADEPPIVTTENATNVSTTSATLNMGFEFHDYRHVRVQFRYKAEGASAWNETGWVSQNGSGAHTYAEPITNLSANTTYNFTALLSYDRAELNGTWFNFTTSREPIAPTVATGNATHVSAATATLNMGYELFKDYSTVRVQFRYKAEGASAWNETGWVSRKGSGADKYAEPIANLSANTTYYFTALLSYDGTKLNGTRLNFTTSREPIPPVVATGNATNVSTTSATLNMGFEFHDYRHVRVQFKYKAEGASRWNETEWVSQNGSGAHTFAEPLANLSANTTYYFMALLSYDGTELNGTELLFTTGREPIPPTVWTGNATNVSVATTTLNMGYELSAKNTDYSMAKTEKATCVPAANVTLDMGFEFHDYSSVQVQFRYKAEGATGWSDTGWVEQNGSGTHTYAKQITYLSPNTTYYYMAMLLYDGMAVNGTVRSFTTCREPIPPTVVTGNATSVSATTATLNMRYEFNDYSPVQVQFRYKAEGASAWTDTDLVSQNGSDDHTYAEQITYLSPNTTYYYMAMLLYDRMEVNSSVHPFTTCRESKPPTVSTEKATNVSVATATLNMAYEFNDYSPVQIQFRYKAEGASAWSDTGWVTRNGSGAHTYAEPIANLSYVTTYYFRALFKYDRMVIEGAEKSFTTFELPEVHTKTATNISDSAARLNMTFDFKDYRTVQVQFRYKAEGASVWNETERASKNGSGFRWYSEPITDLSSDTTYYFKAMLLYDSTELNGTTLSFTTSRRSMQPTVVTGNATNVSATTATLNMRYEFLDYSPVNVRFRYKAEGASVWNETGWVSKNGSGFRRYREPIADLSTNTTYYFMAKLMYDSTVIEGEEKSFMTLEPPTVRTGNATNITYASARLNMTCELNDYDTVQVQFKYKAEGANAWAETGWVYLNGSQTYSESIANLSTITTYYYRAQLLYDSTELEGVEKSFMTLEPPAVHTKTATNITDATATLNTAFDFNEYNSVQVQFRYKANDASAWNDTGWVAQNGSGFHWYREPIAGLSSSTVYQFKAQLRYDGTVIEGTMRSFITMEKPTVSTKNAIVQNLPRGWVVTLKMDYDFKDYDQGYVRFAYKKVGDADWDHTDWMDASHSGTYDELIRGLEDHTTYYFYAQLKYGAENNINGDTLTFKTLVPR